MACGPRPPASYSSSSQAGKLFGEFVPHAIYFIEVGVNWLEGRLDLCLPVQLCRHVISPFKDVLVQIAKCGLHYLRTRHLPLAKPPAVSVKKSILVNPNDSFISLHQPHPQNILKRYHVGQVLEILIAEGFLLRT